MNEMLLQLGKNAKEAENTLRTISTNQKNRVLAAVADHLVESSEKLLEANDLIAQRFGENAVRFGHELRTYQETTGSSAKNPEDYKD